MDTSSLGTIVPAVIEIISTVAGVKPMPANEDFYESGVTSVMALPILLELEDRYGVSIPDDRFIAARSAQAVAQLVLDLKNA